MATTTINNEEKTMKTSKNIDSELFQNFHQYCISHNEIFSSLYAEQKRGWESTALEIVWALRKKRLNTNTRGGRQKNLPKTSNPSVITPSEEEDETMQTADEWASVCSEEDKKETPPIVTTEAPSGIMHTNELRKSDPGYKKYYKFYKTTLPKMDWTCFIPHSNKKFIDIGCSPGGLSSYFIRDLQWSGFGFSLDAEEDGVAQILKHENFTFGTCNLIDPNAYISISNKIILQMPHSFKFHFINLGVVFDRHQISKHPDYIAACVDSLQVIKNSWLVLLNWLENGGNAMWIYTSSLLDVWFFMLKWISFLFEDVKIFPTLVPSRAPVYMLCRNFKRHSLKVVEFHEFLRDVHIDRTNVATIFSIKTDEDCQFVLSRFQKELEYYWHTQEKCLYDIRIAAEKTLLERNLVWNRRRMVMEDAQIRHQLPSLGDCERKMRNIANKVLSGNTGFIAEADIEKDNAGKFKLFRTNKIRVDEKITTTTSKLKSAEYDDDWRDVTSTIQSKFKVYKPVSRVNTQTPNTSIDDHYGGDNSGGNYDIDWSNPEPISWDDDAPINYSVHPIHDEIVKSHNKLKVDDHMNQAKSTNFTTSRNFDCLNEKNDMGRHRTTSHASTGRRDGYRGSQTLGKGKGRKGSKGKGKYSNSNDYYYNDWYYYEEEKYRPQYKQSYYKGGKTSGYRGKKGKSSGRTYNDSVDENWRR